MCYNSCYLYVICSCFHMLVGLLGGCAAFFSRARARASATSGMGGQAPGLSRGGRQAGGQAGRGAAIPSDSTACKKDLRAVWRPEHPSSTFAGWRQPASRTDSKGLLRPVHEESRDPGGRPRRLHATRTCEGGDLPSRFWDLNKYTELMNSCR